MFSYAPLASTLHKKNMSKTDLKRAIKASSATFAKISKDEYISMKVLDQICNELECELSDVVVHIPDKKTT